MIKRIMKSFLVRSGRKSLEELTVEACINNGMKVGENCHGLVGSTIDVAHCWLIEIGDNVTFAPQSYLLAHDASTKRYLDYTKIAKVIIEDNVFIGARSLIMPGVTVGKNSIVAAGSVVVKSVPEGSVVGGNPARVLTRVDDYIKKHHIKIQSARVYDEKWTVGRNISLKKRCQMANELNKKTGYVK